MSDRTETVLAAIDSVTAECICGNPVPTDGPSLDYCSPVCQRSYINGETISEPWPYPATATDGRSINAEVNQRFRPGIDTDDPWTGVMLDIVRRLARTTIPIPDLRHAATFQRVEVADPAGPTAAELDAGTDLTEQIAAGSFSYEPRRTVTFRMSVDATAWDETFARLAAACAGPSSEELAENFRALGEAFRSTEPDPPSTPEEFRRRALEARQTRNTGPSRPDNRRWRNT